jgi:hypothetical protein
VRDLKIRTTCELVQGGSSVGSYVLVRASAWLLATAAAVKIFHSSMGMEISLGPCGGRRIGVSVICSVNCP